MNASQISYEWPVTFVDTVEWVQHPEKSGVFFHEVISTSTIYNHKVVENTKTISFSGKYLLSVDNEDHGYKPTVYILIIYYFLLLMIFILRQHMLVFFCIDFTIWPGWNHRGVYLYSREKEFKVVDVVLFMILECCFYHL